MYTPFAIWLQKNKCCEDITHLQAVIPVDSCLFGNRCFQEIIPFYVQSIYLRPLYSETVFFLSEKRRNISANLNLEIQCDLRKQLRLFHKPTITQTLFIKFVLEENNFQNIISNVDLLNSLESITASEGGQF